LNKGALTSPYSLNAEPGFWWSDTLVLHYHTQVEYSSNLDLYCVPCI